MGFAHNYKTLMNGKTNDLHACPEISALEVETTVEAEMNTTQQIVETSTGFSPDISEKKIKANLEPLHAQIYALTKMMGRLIQCNSARESTTASTREPRSQSESPLTNGPGTSRLPPNALITTTVYSPDNRRRWTVIFLLHRILKLKTSPETVSLRRLSYDINFKKLIMRKFPSKPGAVKYERKKYALKVSHVKCMRDI